MSPMRRKIVLLKANIKQADLARMFNVTPGMIAGLINGRWKSRHLQEKIAAALGTKFETFWQKK